MNRKPNPYVKRYKKLHRQKKKAEKFVETTLPNVIRAIMEAKAQIIEFADALIQFSKKQAEEDKENKNENS